MAATGFFVLQQDSPPLQLPSLKNLRVVVIKGLSHRVRRWFRSNPRIAWRNSQTFWTISMVCCVSRPRQNLQNRV